MEERKSTNNDNKNGKKNNRFNSYWIYAIIFAVLIAFNIYSFNNLGNESISQWANSRKWRRPEMLIRWKSSMAEYAKVYLKEGRLAKYQRGYQESRFGGQTQYYHLRYSIRGDISRPRK